MNNNNLIYLLGEVAEYIGIDVNPDDIKAVITNQDILIDPSTYSLTFINSKNTTILAFMDYCYDFVSDYANLESKSTIDDQKHVIVEALLSDKIPEPITIIITDLAIAYSKLSDDDR